MRKAGVLSILLVAVQLAVAVPASTMLTFRFTDFSPVYPWLKLDNYRSFELRKR